MYKKLGLSLLVSLSIYFTYKYYQNKEDLYCTLYINTDIDPK